MNTEQLAEYLEISFIRCADMADALDGVGFTEDQIISIITAIIRDKKSDVAEQTND